MKKYSLEVFNEETNVNFYGWKLILDGFYFTKALRKYLPTVPRVQTVYLVKDHGQTAIDAESWVAVGSLLLAKLKRRAVPLERLTREHEQLAEEIYELYVLVANADLKRAKNADFLRWFTELWQNYREINSVGMVPVLSDFYHSLLSKELEKILQKRELPNIERQSYLNVLMSPDKPSTAWHEQLEFLNLVKRYKNLRALETSSAYQNHLRKYRWINYGYQGPQVRPEYFLARATKLLKEKRKLSKEIRDHKNYFKRLIKRQKQLEKRLKLSETEKYLFRAARVFTYLKGCRVDARHYFHFASDMMFADLTKRFRAPFNLFRYADPREIAALLRGAKVDRKAVLDRSREMLWYFERGRGARFVSKHQIKRWLKTYVRELETAQAAEVTGQIAYLGRAVGKAKIVNSVKDINKVEHGDILVSTTTNPDLLPAMYRANAFVTDIGGITSHAAIVAREMKKPCVIGTKFATKIFKDGDLVEVDAENGIVRKI